MTGLVELAKRVEALDGPCRETDAEIAYAVRWRWAGWEDGDTRIEQRSLEYVKNAVLNSCNSIWQHLPAYTASLDAAMSLVPEGCQWGAGSRDATGTAWAWTGVTHDAAAISNAATPALALTAACLRALATQGEG